MHVVRKAVLFSLLTLAGATLLAGCHGSDTVSGSASPPTATFTDVVTPNSLTVTFNSAGSVSADGTAATSTWTFGDQIFSTTVATTGAQVSHTYTQPGNYDVTLEVTDDHGTTVDVSKTINVVGTPSVTLGVENWSWINGSKYANGSGTFETEFTPDVLNAPSARQLAASWYSGGKFWMFGGAGNDSTGVTGDLNDLWSCTPTYTAANNKVTPPIPAINSCVWTWVSGSNKANAIGIYPATAGTFSATSLPGARNAGATWTDVNGNMWLFGGSGYDSKGNTGVMNDMWSFSTTGQSEWVSGANVANDQGSASVPYSRAYGVSWTDKYGNFWLFGGEGINGSDTIFYLNDLWCFTPNYVNADGSPQANHPSCANETANSPVPTPVPGKAITSGTWTQITGGTPNGGGVYGTLITGGATTNLPGARISPQGWTDGSGKLWLFGGSGYDSASTSGSLNDVWVFDPVAKTWTWMAGSNVAGAAEATGTQGVTGSGNTPSARLGTVGWTDANGTTLWLFGGSGTDSTGTGTTSDGGGALNELWAFNTTTHLWAFMAGDTTEGIAGVYPVLPQGSASIYGIPGSRLWSNLWVDSSSNAWIFGGSGEDAVGTSGYLSDFWQVNISASHEPQ